VGGATTSAWVEYKKATGTLITDALAKEIAGHFSDGIGSVRAWDGKCSSLTIEGDA